MNAYTAEDFSMRLAEALALHHESRRGRRLHTANARAARRRGGHEPDCSLRRHRRIATREVRHAAGDGHSRGWRLKMNVLAQSFWVGLFGILIALADHDDRRLHRRPRRHDRSRCIRWC